MSISLPQIRSSSAGLGGERSTSPDRARVSWLEVGQTFFFFSTRLAFGAFLLLTSVYCLLVWVPFSYFGFIRNPLVSWIPLFVKLHGLMYGILLCAVALTLIPDLHRKQTRRGALGFLVVNGIALVYVWRGHALASLRPDLESYIWSMLSLFPLVCLAALDLSGENNWISRKPARGLNLAQTALAAVVVAVAFAATSVWRGAIQGNEVSRSLALQGFGVSLCFHFVIFTAVGLILGLIKWATSRPAWPGLLNFVLTRAFAWWVCFQLLRTMILPTISFEGTQANILAAVFSFVVVLFATGLGARLRAVGSCGELPVVRAAAPVWLWGFAAVGLVVAAYGIPVLLGKTDWDFVLQRVAVIAVWLLVLETIGWTGFRVRGKTASIALVLVLTCASAGFVSCARLTLYSPDPSPKWKGALDEYAGVDISFKTAYALLSRPMDNKAYRQFYEFLKQNTNLSHSSVVGPADVGLVSDLGPTPGVKPNIFVFVIDSLRQDYVSPYNPAVDYTPEIDRFAHDSIVLKSAFTRYGGTALSEPAIWVGAMQLHKQYIEPFYPMNNLQKLLETDGYQSYISVDPIVRMMLEPSSSITELDHDSKSWAELDFIPTLKELEAKIDSRSERKKPIFAYTQPQNVHTLTLERSKIKGGRKAVSIYELRRMDAAFGEFLDFLRQRGLYDNSIIVLTADHGDSYGEFGRWGHSDFLFPEVIRIPLIVHLPPQMRQRLVWDPNDPAFTTDITPSLYYLLGHRPIINNELFGRPLFTETPQERLAYKRSQYLIVSSYAAVYAILSGDGRSLFICDAVNSKNYYYNLVEDPAGAHNHVTIQLQNENEALIRHDVGMIDDFYGWHSSQSER
ncbi:MAG: sulfatase-like hydrolase/transferase [Candidatus Sulfotelmatobacter sp.]